MPRPNNAHTLAEAESLTTNSGKRERQYRHDYSCYAYTSNRSAFAHACPPREYTCESTGS